MSHMNESCHNDMISIDKKKARFIHVEQGLHIHARVLSQYSGMYVTVHIHVYALSHTSIVLYESSHTSGMYVTVHIHAGVLSHERVMSHMHESCHT